MEFMMEFHVSKTVRDRYQFDEALFGTNGNVIFTNFHAARTFAQKMNEKRDLVQYPEQAIRAGQINAMGLIDEILHMVIASYKQERNPDVMAKAISWLHQTLGEEAVDRLLLTFTDYFPPLAVYRGELSADEYLQGSTDDPQLGKVPNKQSALEELITIWLANMNPAFLPFIELFDDSPLEKDAAYLDLIAELHVFFGTQPTYGPDNQNLIEMLRAPALANPNSLTGQLEWIRLRWGSVLGKLLFRMLSSLDLIKEEEKAVFAGPGPSVVYEFHGMEKEIERFSPDKDWMPNLVLIAKNAYVWLDQLSKQYQRPIKTLDAIPDEELDKLRMWGISGLWLIGLWERSSASKTIKQMRGNPDAVASAYSLFDYSIAAALGGEPAYQNLAGRCWNRGIRLASDMVPNHMGIDSRWVIEHPDWFLSLDYSPFPSYTFNGPNLSWEPRVGIFIEDHYFNNTDAAVVFKRVDHWTGDTKYIYHGNDGTSMPWNDTAQLNYLKAEVREAVIQTILSVARKFPVIRFDAAMTLAKKHVQRLWFPEPGTGGAIPSRSEHGLTKEQFDAAIPEEFWREVVDRVAQEVPDTLLLAEAFWMLEGYFVRTLGMHRVYNSAFMNMLRDEKNAEYRLAIKNTLEFDPEILKRYVNFMNNPDERTAVDQFGKGDKYFGVCMMMSTQPGLPMIGHGQVEGYTEKYGMEYQRAYWDEKPDQWLVDRHQREIFPLLRKRYLFADVRNFYLYDYFSTDGGVNEDVFAYSNRAGDERSLVLYHNKFATARGWIRTSAAYSVKTEDGERSLVQRTLGEGLGLENDPEMYTIFRDHVSNLEFIRNNRELHEKGLYAELDAYKYQLFVDFRQVRDNEWRQWEQLTSYLNGRGVDSIDEALKEIFLQPIHIPFRELVNPGMYRWIIDNRLTVRMPINTLLHEVLAQSEMKCLSVFEEIQKLYNSQTDLKKIATGTRNHLEAALRLPTTDTFKGSKENILNALAEYLAPVCDDEPAVWAVLLTWIFTRDLGQINPSPGDTRTDEVSRSMFDELLLGKIAAQVLNEMGISENDAQRGVKKVKLLISHSLWCKKKNGSLQKPAELLESWLMDTEFQQYIGMNRYQDVLWYNQESFEDILWWLYLAAAVEINAEEETEPGDTAQRLIECFNLVRVLREAEENSEFKVENLLSSLEVQETKE